MIISSKKDYFKLLEEIAIEQYNSEDNFEAIPEDAWMPAESPAKDRMKKKAFSEVVDATNLRKEKIRNALTMFSNIKVGNFLIRVRNYSADLLDKGVFSITIYERRYKTSTGNPCNMDVPAKLSEDDRFSGRSWLTYFDGAHGENIPIDIIIDIVRWMQAIKKLSAFL